MIDLPHDCISLLLVQLFIIPVCRRILTGQITQILQPGMGLYTERNMSQMVKTSTTCMITISMHRMSYSLKQCNDDSWKNKCLQIFYLDNIEAFSCQDVLPMLRLLTTFALIEKQKWQRILVYKAKRKTILFCSDEMSTLFGRQIFTCVVCSCSPQIHYVQQWHQIGKYVSLNISLHFCEDIICNYLPLR